jgi:hypothetical protein
MEGVCKLTGQKGKFVASHLLPKALTKAGRTKGEKFVEAGPDAVRPSRVSSSWYDMELVTAQGEELLAKYDTHGIQELRRTGLIWSSASNQLLANVEVDPMSGLGMKRVTVNHPIRLRMFLLSILWRASASTLQAFHRISLPPSDELYLRELVLENDPGKSGQFPFILWALVPPGSPHNHTPIFQAASANGSELPVDYFRFYMDGLLVMFGGMKPIGSDFWLRSKSFWDWSTSEIDVITQPFNRSRQKRDLGDVFNAL